MGSTISVGEGCHAVHMVQGADQATTQAQAMLYIIYMLQEVELLRLGYQMHSALKHFYAA